MCAGDILFFGIQCDNPLQFVLAGWVASLVFSNIVYTLTVSFGDIGKALAVVLLVMQVGGSGGTFPIEMTGPVFQAIYPFLPFTHGINAMHAAMAGAYHMEYWVELGILASYLIPSLALGVVFLPSGHQSQRLDHRKTGVNQIDLVQTRKRCQNIEAFQFYTLLCWIAMQRWLLLQ